MRERKGGKKSVRFAATPALSNPSIGYESVRHKFPFNVNKYSNCNMWARFTTRNSTEPVRLLGKERLASRGRRGRGRN